VRKPRSPAWARYSGFAVALISAAAALASSAGAQTRRVTDDPPLCPRTVEAVRVLPSDICRNRQLAPHTIAVQSGLTVVATTGFTGAIMGRLDSVRGQAAAVGALTSLGTDGLMGLGAGGKSKAPQPGAESPLTVYGMGTFLGGSRADAPNMTGFGYDAISGTVGIEYSVDRNLIVGLAANYTTTNADLHSGATIDVDAIQAAAYLSYATRQWFVDALAAYGSHDLDLARPGLIDPIRSSTYAGVFALAARAGYLFDFGRLRAGPIAGLTYIRSRIDGYTEKGDPNLTFTVSAQTLESLTGSLGIRFLTSFQAGGNLVIPYLNITWEHQFGDSTRTLATSLTQVPSLPPILSTFPRFDTRDFGKIDAGVTVQLGPDLSATVSAASTFARDESYDFRISTGLNFRF